MENWEKGNKYARGERPNGKKENTDSLIKGKENLRGHFLSEMVLDDGRVLNAIKERVHQTAADVRQRKK